MKNLSNTNYDPNEVYIYSEELEPDISSDKLDADIENLTKDDKFTDNFNSISSMCIIKDSDFDSLYLHFVTNK